MTRKLSFRYDARGNLTSKTSSVREDIGTTVSEYLYGKSAKPNRLTGATIGGKDHDIRHDANGNIDLYQCTAASGCGPDKSIGWNGRNLPERITLGAGKTPAARDEFAYGPDGARYRRTTTLAGGGPEHTHYVGGYEELLPGPGAVHRSIEQTRVTDAVRHVRAIRDVTDAKGNKETIEDNYVDYVHKDHLGSAEATTDASGSRTRALAHDPFGGRRKADWTRALTESERAALAGSPLPRTRGHTGHEHLDRTGFIHRGGRVHDPTLGRFLSPDPLVSDPGSAQSWNSYSYVSNSPMSFVDPSGLSQRQAGGGCVMVGFACGQGAGGAAGGGFGLASVVSTHHFQWVDVFFSFVSSWFNPGWGGLASTPPYNPNPYNFWGGGGVGDGGWDSYDSPGVFHFGIAFFSAAFQVTSHVAVAGTPDITRKPMGVIRGLLEGGASILIPGYDLYECYIGEGCTASDVIFGTIEVATTLTGVGYLGRVAAKGAVKAYKAYKVAREQPRPKIGSAGGEGAGRPFRDTIKAQARADSKDTCVFCGVRTTREPRPNRSEIDHAIPRSRGGSNNLENAQNTCRTCNRQKGAKTTEEYLNR